MSDVLTNPESGFDFNEGLDLHYQQMERENKLVLSYLTVRKIIGLLGFCLPFTLVTFSIILGNCKEIQPSISNYYHTIMRDVFVGYMCSLSIFLLSYKGYDSNDRKVSFIAGICGLIVALFPTAFQIPVLPCNIECNITRPDFVGKMHLVFAGLFLMSLAAFSYFLFPKGERGPNRKSRIHVFKFVGVFMFFLVGLLISYFALSDADREAIEIPQLVFYLESLAVMAFGFSWLLKGK